MKTRFKVLLPLLLVAALPAVVQAQFTITTNGAFITITKYTGPGGSVVIPNMTNGYEVRCIADYAFEFCANVTSVTIPDSVTSIGVQAFTSCTSLTNVMIGNAVTSIGDTAFAGSGLSGVIIPSSVTNIGVGTFNQCTSLTGITVDTNNLSYSSSAGVLFNKNQTTLVEYSAGSAETSYSIPNGVTSIGYGAFQSCHTLTNITIPDSVTNIGDYAFVNCFRLRAITVDTNNPAYISVAGVLFNRSQTTLIIYPTGSAETSYSVPVGVTSIGDYAFDGYSLTNITLPNSVTTIADDAFLGLLGLTAITVATNNPTFSSVAGVLFDKSQTMLIRFPAGKVGSYTIPNSVSSIGSNAFCYCLLLTNVTIGNAVTTIGENAFSDSGLTSVTLPSGVTNIGVNAFCFCTSLMAITVDTNNPTYSGAAGVLFNKSQTTLLEYPGGKPGKYTIANSVTNIAVSAFNECASLTSITIPDGVTAIESYAFLYCTSLTSVYFKGNAPTVDLSVFFGDINATAFYLPGTTGWVDFSATTGLPTVLWNPQVQTRGANFGARTNGFGFTVIGSSNLVIVVEACANLSKPVWSPVGTNTLIDGSSYFSDPEWTNYPARLYRIRSP